MSETRLSAAQRSARVLGIKGRSRMNLEQLLAEVEAAEALRASSTDGLLTAYVHLTRLLVAAENAATRMVGGDRLRAEARQRRLAEAAEHREARDKVRAEILRRTGEL